MLKTKCRPAVDDGNLPVKCRAVCKIAGSKRNVFVYFAYQIVNHTVVKLMCNTEPFFHFYLKLCFF